MFQCISSNLTWICHQEHVFSAYSAYSPYISFFTQLHFKSPSSIKLNLNLTSSEFQLCFSPSSLKWQNKTTCEDLEHFLKTSHHQYFLLSFKRSWFSKFSEPSLPLLGVKICPSWAEESLTGWRGRQWSITLKCKVQVNHHNQLICKWSAQYVYI